MKLLFSFIAILFFCIFIGYFFGAFEIRKNYDSRLDYLPGYTYAPGFCKYTGISIHFPIQYVLKFSEKCEEIIHAEPL